MGIVVHNTIVVTSSSAKHLDDATAKAKELGLEVLGPSQLTVNGYRTIMICPDGSKEYWPQSNDGDEKRKQFREYLHKQRYSDNSSHLEWFEAAYGSDNDGVDVIDNTWTIPITDGDEE